MEMSSQLNKQKWGIDTTVAIQAEQLKSISLLIYLILCKTTVKVGVAEEKVDMDEEVSEAMDMAKVVALEVMMIMVYTLLRKENTTRAWKCWKSPKSDISNCKVP